MTVGDKAPQDAGHRSPDLEHLVQALAERVALLENKEEENPEVADEASSPVVIAEKEDESPPSVHGIIEKGHDYDEENISGRLGLIENRLDAYDDEKEMHLDDDNKYTLSESTFSLLITQHPLSVPFAFAVFSVTLSISCLSLTLASSINKGTKNNRLGIPAGVSGLTRAAQFFGALVGVLMEDEIPQGLQLIANGAGHSLMLDGQKEVRKRVLISSIFRLAVGYLFLSSLFMNIVQNDEVIEIFYDVLALEFVENIDDTTFALAKRGFFGRRMLLATNQKHTLEMAVTRQSLLFESRSAINERRLSSTGLIASDNWTNRIIRFVYFLNAAIIIVGLAYITTNQANGRYRCSKITVLFDEEIYWENAIVRHSDGSIGERLLMYPYFNGIYREDGSHDGYPRYVEQNKDEGTPFGSSVKGAQIIYCKDIGSWVFMHYDIMTSRHEAEENECSWLWRSSQTQSYDIISTTEGPWEAWTGVVKPLAFVSITCNECSERSDCNYHGTCEDSVCVCDQNRYGDLCHFGSPCKSLATEKAQKFDEKGVRWEQEKPIEDTGRRVYNRPVYIQSGLSGEPYDLRLYKILEKEISSSPSDQPSSSPSVSQGPTPSPTPYPTYSPMTLSPTPAPSVSKPTKSPYPTYTSTSAATSTVGTNKTMAPSPGVYADAPSPGVYADAYTDATPFPTEPLHTQKEYDTAPDFADYDDFFESPALHDGLKDILDGGNYSVILSYSGSRFYGTIVGPNSTLDELFPKDYHAFWTQAFDVDRTFIISDKTSSSTPLGVDFFEMRRRIDSLRNPNVQFNYGPYGAEIPLMNYEGTGFFHCLDVSSQPSSSPSSSVAPTTTVSPSQTPTEECCFVEINMLRTFPNDISWTISKLAVANGTKGESLPIESSSFQLYNSLQSDRVCLLEGGYVFTIYDSYGDGLFPPPVPHYNLTSYGELIHGGNFTGFNETAVFFIPFKPEQTSQLPTPVSFPASTGESNESSPVIASDDVIRIPLGTDLAFISVLENDIGSNLQVRAITQQAAHGDCSISIDLFEVVYVLTDLSYTGSDECTYEACDAEENCDTAVVEIAINEVNVQPIFKCPAASFVGCTADDPSNPQDECTAVGTPCPNANPGEFCCVDGCPRNYCTSRQGP